MSTYGLSAVSQLLTPEMLEKYSRPRRVTTPINFEPTQSAAASPKEVFNFDEQAAERAAAIATQPFRGEITDWNKRVAPPADLSPRAVFGTAMNTSMPPGGQAGTLLPGSRQDAQLALDSAGGGLPGGKHEQKKAKIQAQVDGLINASVPTPEPAQHKSGWRHRIWDAIRLAGAIGNRGGDPSQMLGAFMAGAIKPEAYEAHKYRYEQMPEYERQRDREAQQALRQAQIDNYYADNQRRQSEFQSNLDFRKQQQKSLEEDRSARLDQRKREQADRNLDDWMLRNPGRPIPKRLAEEAGRPELTGYTPPAKATGRTSGSVQVREGANGELMERNPETGVWTPAMTAGGDVFRTPRVNQERKVTASDRSAAKVRARNRVNQEYTGSHINQIINDYANGLYQTYAQEMGINWEIEQKARTPVSPDDKKYFEKQEEFLKASQMVQAARSRARTEAKRIVERDLERLESVYLDEELERLESGTSPMRPGSRPASRPQVPQRTAEQDRAEGKKALDAAIARVQADTRLTDSQKRTKIEQLQDLFNKTFGQ